MKACETTPTRLQRLAPPRRPTRTAALALLVLLVPFLTGMTAQRMWKDGTRLEEQGSYYAAALKYLDALDKNHRHKKAGQSIVAVAERAYQQKLEIAVTYEGDERFPDALEEYEALSRLLDRLEGVSAKNFATIDVRAKIGEMSDASAEQQYKGGKSAMERGDWSKSISYFKAAQSFRRGYKDTQELIATARYSWADEDLGKRRYRDAADRFVRSADDMGSAGFKDAAERAAGIYASMGRYFLDNMACRLAISDFNRASRLASHPRLAEWSEEAESCAVTPVAVLPFENPTGRSVAGMALGDILSDQVGGKVGDQASRFVRLIERGALDQILAEQGLSQAGITTGGSSKIQGVRYLVIGKLTQVRFDNPGLRRESKSTVGTKPYSCTKTRSNGDSYQGTCHSEVRVDYVEIQGSIGIQIAGSVKVVDVLSGEQLVSQPIEAVANDAVHYIESPTVGGNTVQLTMWQHNDGIGVRDRDLRQMAEARRDLADEGSLASSVVDYLSTQAAGAAVDVIDIDDNLADPDELDTVIIDELP